MKAKMITLVAVMMCSVVLLSVFTGCEDAGGTSGLAVSPSSVTFGDVSGTNGGSSTAISTTFTVDSTSLTLESDGTNTTASSTSNLGDLALPLEWSVTDASMGSIVSSSGYSALYQRTSVNGDNTIIVRDQYGNEGYASIHQQ